MAKCVSGYVKPSDSVIDPIRALPCVTREAYRVHMDAYSVGVIAGVTRAMEGSGETRTSLSQKSGIPRPTLIRSLDGHRPLNTDEMAAIAQALDIDVIDLAKSVAA